MPDASSHRHFIDWRILMSICREFAGAPPPGDVHVTQTGLGVDKPRSADETRRNAESTKRRNGLPVDAPLSRTFKRVAKPPRDVRPIRLLRAFPRIAILMAPMRDEPESMHGHFDECLVDRGGNRKGFAPEVVAELLALRNHCTGLRARPAGAWEQRNHRP
jgi:hypothetical protein